MVRVAKVDQGLGRVLQAGDQPQVGPKLNTVRLEQGKLTFCVARHGRKPCSLLQRTRRRGRSFMPIVGARCRRLQGFANPAQDIFTFPSVHRVFQKSRKLLAAIGGKSREATHPFSGGGKIDLAALANGMK